MRDFQITKISNPSLSSALTKRRDDIQVNKAHGVTILGRSFYQINYGSTFTFIYDPLRNKWYRWFIRMRATPNSYLSDWTIQTGNNQGFGILLNGDILSVFHTGEPYDSSNYDTQAEVVMTIETGTQDFGTRKRKFMSNLRIDGFISDEATSPWNATVWFRDNGEINETLISSDIDLTNQGSIIPRCGSFHSRSIVLSVPTNTVSGNARKAVIYNLEFDLSEGLQ